MMIVQHFENQEEEALYDKRVLYLAEEKWKILFAELLEGHLSLAGQGVDVKNPL